MLLDQFVEVICYISKCKTKLPNLGVFGHLTTSVFVKFFFLGSQCVREWSLLTVHNLLARLAEPGWALGGACVLGIRTAGHLYYPLVTPAISKR